MRKSSKLILLTTLGILIIGFFPIACAEPGKWPAYLYKKPGYFGFSGGYHIGA